LAGLPLLQRGEGVYIDCAWPKVNNTLVAGFGQNFETTQPDDLLIHFINKTGVYLYSADRAEKYMWQRNEALEYLKPIAYETDLLEKFTAEEAAVLERMPFEKREWIEECGADARIWAALIKEAGAMYWENIHLY
jgi:hypothetical protein